MMSRIPTRQVANRYHVTPRSVDRWVRDRKLGFPKPITINNRNYFSETELAEFDKARADARNIEEIA